jgi:radical SAM protein with 4Fe4S-binding SPASM domain
MRTYCSVPYVYTLEITSDCNADCVGCGNVFRHDGTYLTLEQIQTILGRISPYVEMLRLTGGEPTVSPFFAQILEILDLLDKPMVVFSNGLWQEPDAVIGALRQCRNLDGILVSLHGHCPEAYQSFTRVPQFARVLDNIQRATEAGITVNTNTILTRQNIDHMAEVVDVAMQAGAQVIAFSRYYGLPISGLTDLGHEEYRYAVEQVTRFRTEGKRVKFNNNIPFCLGGVKTQVCPAGDTHCTISPTCKVRVCNHSPFEIGDILTTSMEEIWRGETVDRWRGQLPEMCRQCTALDRCGGGCKANAQANGLTVDPLACGPSAIDARTPDALQHSLPAGAFPRAEFSLREESFGYVLINRTHILKVAPTAKPFLEVLLRGDRTLAEIDAAFGHKVLNLVGLLYDSRMLELSPMPTSPVKTPAIAGWEQETTLQNDAHPKVKQLEQAKAEIALYQAALEKPESQYERLEPQLGREEIKRRLGRLQRRIYQLEGELEELMGRPDKRVPQVTWLHLSDLHFRVPKQPTTRGLHYDADVVLSSLLEDVAERSTENGLEPDFVIVTGDIAFSGAAREYELARLFFDDLLKITRLPKDWLFLVPGNHDVDRKRISRGAEGIAASLKDREAVNAVLATPGDRNLMLARLHAYMKFVGDYFGPLLPAGPDHTWYVRSFNAGWRRVALIGLNSAWLAHGGHQDLGCLTIGEMPTRLALQQANTADLKVALLHHPLSWLHEFDQDDSGAMLADRCDFILHGHLHKVGLQQIHGPDTNAMFIAAGACYETRRSSNSYNLVQLDLSTGEGTVYLRAFVDKRGGFWTWDGMTYRNVPDGIYHFDLNDR